MTETDWLSLYPEFLARYSDSVRLMVEKFGVSPETGAIIYRVLAECEAARKYPWPGPDAVKRNLDRDALEEAPGAKGAAQKLARYLRTYAGAASEPVLKALLNGKLSIRRRDADRTDQVEALADILERLAASLNQPGPLARRGPMMHRWRHGPLLFSQPLEGKPDRPEPQTCLAAYLSFLFRLQAHRGTMWHGEGEPMPPGRAVHWTIVATLVSEALIIPYTYNAAAGAVRGIMESNPDIRFIGY